jgi:predicted RNA-binding Zn ribbon-like protein
MELLMDQHSPAIFVGDAPALDFLNSIATPVDIPVDSIADGAGLLDWLEQAQLVPAGMLKDMRHQASPGELDAVAAQARNLREWFRAFVQKHKGRPLVSKNLEELAQLNRLLERDEAFARIVARHEKGQPPLELQVRRRWRGPEALLLPIGEALAQFVCTEDFSLVKACEGAACTLVFADHTRGRARRWCSMAICGNRAKQAAHRHRRRDAR